MTVARVSRRKAVRLTARSAAETVPLALLRLIPASHQPRSNASASFPLAPLSPIALMPAGSACSGRPIHHLHDARRGQIPIVPAAPATPN